MAQYNTKGQASIANRRWYTDIDINMLNHPQNKDLVLKYDISAIKRSVRNLLSTPILGPYYGLGCDYWSQGFLVLDFNFFLVTLLFDRRLKNKIAIAPKTNPPM